jgi:regulation of enolase protein 1 (concanavalin A-like superfamily)
MKENNLFETFNGRKLNEKLCWLHEPSKWELKNGQLKIFPDAATDYWQRTHYGFQADNGHFYYVEIEGDFIMETEVDCDFKHQYDQAGLMVRVSDQCWLKTAVEFEPDEPNKLGSVVTNNGFSDWSTQDVEDSFSKFKLRIIRKASDYKVEYYDPKTENWIQLRLLHLFDESSVKVGIYACSPKQKLFSARFNYLKIENNNE